MKRTLISSAIIASALFSGIASAVTVNGGSLEFKGELVNASCAVDTSSANQTINMGQIRTGSFTSVGSTTGPVPFEIRLTGCDTAVIGGATTPPTVKVGFTGVVDSTNANALSVTGTGAAKGIGLQILDRSGTAVPFDGTATTELDVVAGNMSIPFNARYISTLAAVVAGSANANATFYLTYE